ncbi:MAG: hypothetical protein KBH99_10565 [Syntrophobacteraceae bacterium]|nr:hypothetical protein [Syntrophobacteraceae bacterium]
MDLDRALRVFKLYCEQWKEDPRQAEGLLLTDEEKQSIQELKNLIREYAPLIEKQDSTAA